MDWTKVILSGVKYFGVAIIGVLIAALTVAITGFKPEGPLQVVIAQYLVIPLLTAIVGALNNIRKHWGDK